jgi:hypothetical protein
MRNKRYTSKIITIIILMMTFGFWNSNPTFASDNEIKCFLDGKELHFDVRPIVEDGVTYVPMRAIFEAQGADIKWDNMLKTISAVKGDTNIYYMVNFGKVFVNGQENEQMMKAIIVQNNTLVPLRFISEVLGSTVSWDSGTKSVNIISPVVEEKAPLQINTTLTLGSKNVSKWLYDQRNSFQIAVKHYGISNNQLYSMIQFSNTDNKDIYISLKPSDKKLIGQFSKEIDPRPNLRIEDCTVVTNKLVIDNIGGKTYNIPEFSVNQDCVSSNQAQRNAYEEWRKNNSGFSVVGSNIVTVRRYVQDQSGGLQSFVIPANKTEQLILIAPVGGMDRLVVEGSYFVGGIIDKTIDFKLDYEVASELDLGIYSLIYTRPAL